MNPLSKLCCCSSDEINWLNIFRLIDSIFGNKYVIKLLIFVYYTDYLHHLSNNNNNNDRLTAFDPGQPG